MINAVKKIADILKEHQIEDAKLEARMMLASVLNIDENNLFFTCPEPNAEQKKHLHFRQFFPIPKFAELN